MTPIPLSSAAASSTYLSSSSSSQQQATTSEWHDILAHANQCVPMNDLKNANELFMRAKFLRKVKKSPENPSSWAIYLNLLEKERASANQSLPADNTIKRAIMRDALQKLYETVTGLIPFTTSNRCSEEYLSIWLGYAKLQAEEAIQDARKTFKMIKSSRIGTYLPLLYETWAQLEEQHGNPEKAGKLRAEAEKLPPIASSTAKSSPKTSARPVKATVTSAPTRKRNKQSPPSKTNDLRSAARSAVCHTKAKDSPPKRIAPSTESVEERRANQLSTSEVSKDSNSASNIVEPQIESGATQKQLLSTSEVSKDSNSASNIVNPRIESEATQKRVPLAEVNNRIHDEVQIMRKITVVPEKRRHFSPATPPVSKRVHELREEHQRSKENAPPLSKKVLSPGTEAVTKKYLRPEGFSRRPMRQYEDESPRGYRESPPRSRLDEAFSRSNRVRVNGRAYQILRQVGRGGSSTVFQVISENMEILALKKVQVSPSNHFAMSSYANEISLLDRLKGEKDIVKLYDAEVNRVTGTIHLLMECGDTDLSALLKGRSLEDDEIRTYWRQMLQAVHTIHGHKVIHGDLKPANFISTSGRIKLIDFGIAKSIADTNGSDDCTKIVRECITGTPNYMAPEALVDISMEHGGEGDMEDGIRRKRGYRVGRGSDIWSLGCILYLITHGKTPFAHIRDSNRKISAIKDPTREIEYAADIDPNVLDVLRGCLQRDPTKRMTIPELLQHPFLNGGSVGSVTPDSISDGKNSTLSPPIRTDDFLAALKEENLFLCDRRCRPLPPTSAKTILDRILSTPKRSKIRSARFGKSHGTPSVSASVSAVTKL